MSNRIADAASAAKIIETGETAESGETVETAETVETTETGETVDGGVLGPIPVTRTSQSRLPGLDLSRSAFGEVFADHMLTMTCDDGIWSGAEIVPYGPFALEPGVMTFHYSQCLFEGLKAYRGPSGEVRLFRPELNGRRMQDSCEFLAIPPMPDGAFEDALAAYLRIDAGWVPEGAGLSLYLRPLIFSIEPHLDVRPSRRFRFVVLGAPVGGYFAPGKPGLSLLVEEHLARVAPGSGMGAAKASANYTPSLRASREANERGYDHVIWLDGAAHRWVEEAGLANIFAVIDGTVVTPPLNGNILPGITRDSTIALLRDWGVPVEERPLAIDELAGAIERGTATELFAAGHDGQTLTGRVARTLTDIQYGRGEDPHGWSRIVVPDADAGTIR